MIVFLMVFTDVLQKIQNSISIIASPACHAVLRGRRRRPKWVIFKIGTNVQHIFQTGKRFTYKNVPNTLNL